VLVFLPGRAQPPVADRKNFPKTPAPSLTSGQGCEIIDSKKETKNVKIIEKR
jgi:hypothetical protein